MALDLYQMTVETLADEFGISVESLNNPFKLHFGKSKVKRPYSFDAKTVKDVLLYLTRDRRRRYDRFEGSFFAWNVKTDYLDATGHQKGFKPTAKLDKAWQAYLESKAGEHVYCRAYEDAQEYYRRDWCAYPGEDQGAWKFQFAGRSGGWLCLEAWRGNNISRFDWDDCARFLATLVAEYVQDGLTNLSSFYVGIVCADSDFTPKKASENVSHNYAEARQQWEVERAEIARFVEDAIKSSASTKAAQYGYDLNPVTLQDVARKAANEITKGLEV